MADALGSRRGTIGPQPPPSPGLGRRREPPRPRVPHAVSRTGPSRAIWPRLPVDPGRPERSRRARLAAGGSGGSGGDRVEVQGRAGEAAAVTGHHDDLVDELVIRPAPPPQFFPQRALLLF